MLVISYEGGDRRWVMEVSNESDYQHPKTRWLSTAFCHAFFSSLFTGFGKAGNQQKPERYKERREGWKNQKSRAPLRLGWLWVHHHMVAETSQQEALLSLPFQWGTNDLHFFFFFFFESVLQPHAAFQFPVTNRNGSPFKYRQSYVWCYQSPFLSF